MSISRGKTNEFLSRPVRCPGKTSPYRMIIRTEGQTNRFRRGAIGVVCVISAHLAGKKIGFMIRSVNEPLSQLGGGGGPRYCGSSFFESCCCICRKLVVYLSRACQPIENP